MSLEVNVIHAKVEAPSNKSAQKEEGEKTAATTAVAALNLSNYQSESLSLFSPPPPIFFLAASAVSSQAASPVSSQAASASSSSSSPSSHPASIPPQQVEEDQSKSFQESTASSKKEILLDLPPKAPIEPKPISIPFPAHISKSELPPIKMIAPSTELSAQEFTELSLTSPSSAASTPPQQVEEDQSKSFQESTASSKKEILLDLPPKAPIEPKALSIPLPDPISKSELPPIKMIAPPPELSAQEFTELSMFQKFLKRFTGQTKATIEHLKEFEKALSENKKWLNYPLMESIDENTVSFAKGNTILHLFGQLGGSEEFIRLLLKHGCDLSIKEKGFYGNTPLHWSIANARNSTALAFINESPKEALSIKDNSHRGNTPLHMTIAKGYKDKNADGQALTVTNAELTQQLIQRGAEINATNAYGLTPLHIACLRHDVSSIKWLLKYGARLDVVSNDGQTPLELIEINNHTTAQEYIVSKVTNPIILDKSEYDDNYAKAIALLKPPTP